MWSPLQKQSNSQDRSEAWVQQSVSSGRMISAHGAWLSCLLLPLQPQMYSTCCPWGSLPPRSSISGCIGEYSVGMETRKPCLLSRNPSVHGNIQLYPNHIIEYTVNNSLTLKFAFWPIVKRIRSFWLGNGIRKDLGPIHLGIVLCNMYCTWMEMV